jgi:hypothetical protein
VPIVIGSLFVALARCTWRTRTPRVLPGGELQKTLDRAERSSLERVGWGLLYRDLQPVE